MGYSLGIDVGTTFTAAAIWRDGQVEVVALESHRVAIPSVVFASGDEVVFGTAAVGRAMTEPTGAAREFKRRLGDPVPIVLSGAPYSADRLVALFARWVRTSVSEQFGEPPERVVVTHPANWTEFQLHLLATALQQAGLGETGLLSEPQAAAVDFGAAARLEPGELVVVYDLGGGTFDVDLLRREGDGFAHVGEPAGVERLGGIDFDEAVFQHVVSHVPAEAVTQARSDQAGLMALTQLRRACVEAKERLSSEVAVEVPVVLPAHTSAVRLTRSEFESMIRPMLQQTVELVRQVIDRAGLTADQLSAILLVGGSSRIPLVSELVSQAIGAPVRVDAHPKLVVARGAARSAGSGPVPPVTHETARSRRKWWLAAAGVGALVAVGAGAMALTGGDGENTSDDTDPTSATAVAPATSTGPTPSTSPATPATAAASSAPPTTPAPASTAPPTTVAHVSGVDVLGTATFPADRTVSGRPFGGASGIALDPVTGSFVVASDNAQLEERDIDESLLYGAEIDLGDDVLDDGDVQLGTARRLLDEDETPFVRLDAEAVAVDFDQRVFVAIEGSSPEGVTAPKLLEFDADGQLVGELPMPAWYTPSRRAGITQLGGFSALTFAPGNSPLLVGGFDSALRQDTDGVVRLISFDPASGEAVAEYGYPLDDESENGGLFDIAAIDDQGTIVAIEYSSLSGTRQLVLYEVDLRAAEAGIPQRSSPPLLEKRPIANLSEVGVPGPAFQAMGRGPDLSDGSKTLILVSDNEFAQDTTFVALQLQFG